MVLDRAAWPRIPPINHCGSTCRLASITDIRIARAALNLALAMTDRAGDAAKEVTIEGAIPWHDRIRELHDALQRCLTARRGAA